MLQKYRSNTLHIKHFKFCKNIKTCFIFQCRCDHISLGILQEIKGTWWRILRICSSFCFECGFGWFHVDFALIILQFWMHFGPLVGSRKNVSKGKIKCGKKIAHIMIHFLKLRFSRLLCRSNCKWVWPLMIFWNEFICDLYGRFLTPIRGSFIGNIQLEYNQLLVRKFPGLAFQLANCSPNKLYM